MAIEIKDIDKRIWEEELADFVPQKIYDVHTHVYLPEYCLTRPGDDPAEPETWTDRPIEVSDRETLDQCYAALCPGREVHYLIMPWVFRRGDIEGINRFAAVEAGTDPLSVAFMLVHPSFSAEQVSQAIDAHGFCGLKPYFTYVEPGDGKQCRITDMLPEPLIALADARELIVMLHLGKSLAIADEENIRDLIYLSQRYPRVRWILAHLARCLVPWPLERAIDRIKDLPNLWYDFSSVCNSDVYSLVFRNVGLDRIMFGSDNLPVGVLRGTYVGFAYAWAYLSERTIDGLGLTHCDGRPTFILYEELRAARRAMMREGFGREQIEDIFYNNAMRLLSP